MKTTPKIQTIEQIKNTTGRIYVRWSNSITADIKRGYSLRCGNQEEAGLSVVEIDPEWADWRILRKVTEYQFTGASHCWLVTGDEVGRGGDDEPLLDNVQLVGEIAQNLTNADWKTMQLKSYIAENKERLDGITDEIARRQTEEGIARYEKLLSDHLAGKQIEYIS